jgi:hypothetical protein
MSASRRPLAAVAAAAGLALAGCGGGGGSAKSNATAAPATAGAQKLALTAGPGSRLKFDKKTLHAKAGRVTIVMANPSALSHSVALEGNGVNAAGQVVAPNGTSTVSATLKPGSYTFFARCPDTGRQACRAR